MKAYRLVDYYAGEESKYYLNVKDAEEEYVSAVSERIFEKDYEDGLNADDYETEDAFDAEVERLTEKSKEEAKDYFNCYIKGIFTCSDYDYLVEVIDIKE